MNSTGLLQEFDRQVATVMRNGYAKMAGIPARRFAGEIEPLRRRVAGIRSPAIDLAAGRLPFVLVIKSERDSAERFMRRVKRKGSTGVVRLHPRRVRDFKPIESIKLPAGLAYLVVDVDRGCETRNVRPEQALKTIRRRRRSPLTIDEGIAIVTHFPDFLAKNHCFSLLASRGGDRRVPALWLSCPVPKLGWCWDGNPRTWLGSASCRRRLGATQKPHKRNL
jgi:hypothetical protein